MLTFLHIMYRTHFLLVFVLLTLALVGCQDDQRAASIERIDGVLSVQYLPAEDGNPPAEG